MDFLLTQLRRHHILQDQEIIRDVRLMTLYALLQFDNRTHCLAPFVYHFKGIRYLAHFEFLHFGARLFGSVSESVDLTGVSLPIKIYIDRETLYPVQMRMEMTEFGKQLLDALSVVKVNVDAFDAVIDYSGINETSAGEAPQVG